MHHTRARLLLLALALGAACGSRTEAEIRERELCYTRAESAAQARVDTECKGVTLSACRAGDAIVEDLQRAQEACP